MPEPTCDIHGETLIWEDGGPTMPTIFGRLYCPTCQEEFVTFLEAADDGWIA